MNTRALSSFLLRGEMSTADNADGVEMKKEISVSSFSVLSAVHLSSFWLVLFSVLPGGYWLSLPSARAGTSANYTLAPDALDNGGLRAISAAYVANLSNTPGGAGASAAYILRSGFAGQLFETTGGNPTAIGISITASPLTINEAGTRQLAATLLYSDSTTAPLAATSLTWAVQSGPLTGISTTGLATAATVYQNTIAVARGTYLTFTSTTTLSVLNTLPDNFGAYAGDGMDDAWQVQYFGQPPNGNAAPGLDPDGDGSSNLTEFNAGTIPTSAASVFRITGLIRSSPNLTISFSSVTGRNYTLWRHDVLSPGPWTNTSLAVIAGNGANQSFVIPAPVAGVGKRFYRVQAEP